MQEDGWMQTRRRVLPRNCAITLISDFPASKTVSIKCLLPKPPRASLVAQLVKNPSAVRETWVRFLGWEDPLEKGKATNSRILAWRIPWTV